MGELKDRRRYYMEASSVMVLMLCSAIGGSAVGALIAQLLR